MKGGPRFYLAGLLLLLALAGCGRSMLQYGERASWRHEAEVECLKSGKVMIGTGVVQIQPIEGPGMCGADFPLKVTALGQSSAISYADDPRPPGAIPNAPSAQMPRWPASEPRYANPAPVQPVQVQPVQSQPLQTQPVQSQPAQGQPMRWVPGPPGIERPEASAPAGRPMSLNPPGVAPYHDDIPDDAVLPPGRGPAPASPGTRPAYNAPVYQAPPQQQQQQQQRALPPLGPMRGPQSRAAIMPAAVMPPATLACPLVSALERWVTDGVQPAAMHWFRAQVVEIKQISAYSCRSMVGAGTSNISEHAFGNALDIAAFTFADGRKVTVRDGWHGTPEEQGFLRDVHLFACETFSTVLAPGYNAAHYDHIHVDLMRREAGRRPCRPDAIAGEVVAAKARAIYASKQRGPRYTGSIAAQAGKIGKPPLAVPGEDGDVADEDGDAAVTGSIAAPAARHKPARHATAIPGADGDFDDEEITGMITAPSRPIHKKTVPAEDRLTAH
jgi:hypothetical protein